MAFTRDEKKRGLARLEREVSSWEGVTKGDEIFGGTQFSVGGVPFGHFHANGLVDIPFPRRVQLRLIRQGRTGPDQHHTRAGSTTFFIRSAEELENAIWLFGLAYALSSRRAGAREHARG
jgi:hypothetical protein